MLTHYYRIGMSFSPLNHSLSVYRMNACQSFRKRSSISCPGDIAKSLEERWKAYCTLMSSPVQLKCTEACYPLAGTLALVCICSRDLATHELFQVLRTAAEESILYKTFVQILLLAETILLWFASVQSLKSAMQESELQ